MIKLIASDMDGTLLDGKGNLPSDFYEVFEELKENDVKFVCASGRQYYNLLKTFEPVKDDIIFLSENGTYAVYKDKELFSNVMDRNIVSTFLEITKDIEKVYPVICGKKSAYLLHNDEGLMKEIHKYYERYEVVNDFSEIDDEVIKFTICDLIGSEENSYQYFKEFSDDYQVSISGRLCLDITNLGANKGTAMKNIQDKLNIEFKETMVFGDYLNDLELMKSGYHSYAMENAHPDLKKVARFSAGKNTENGVLEKINEVVLNKEKIKSYD